MALIKTPEEIQALKEGGILLSKTLRSIRKACVAGVSTKSLDDLAQKLIAEAGGTPSFLNYRISPKDPGYPAAVCTSINDEVVHGIPKADRILKDGDIIGLDIGMWYKNVCTDMATTVMIGNVSPKVAGLVAATRESLVRGIATIKNGSLISDIGGAIEDFIKPKGYGIVKEMVGHGVGHAVHEDPVIEHYRDPHARRVVCKTGMVLAVEPMINLGDWRIYQKDDGWTIATRDGSVSAHFEVTVVVTDDGYELVTPWPDEEVGKSMSR
ncbi:MAG: type I methionyl aminopeptidase [Patescibacteria group bacterium]